MRNRILFDYFKIVTYLLFVYSGLLKWIPIAFPVDFTIFFGGLTVIPFITYLFKPITHNSLIKYITFLVLLLMVLFLLSNIYTISSKYAQSKSIAIVLNMYAFIYPLIVIRKEDYTIIKKVFIVFTIITLMLLLVVYINDLSIIFYINEESQIKMLGYSIPTYLTIGGLISVGFLFLLNDNTIFSILLKIVIFVFLVLLSGRGPLFILIISIISYYLISNYAKIISFKNLFLLLLLIVAATYFIDFDQINLDRLNLFQSSGNDENTQVRVKLIGIAIKSFLENPIFGLGIGSSGLILIQEDVFYFPHNLFLEALIEIGIFGGVIYLAIYLLLLSKLRKIRKNEVLLILFLIVFNHFGQDLKSNSFDSWRISVCWISIFLAIYRFNFTNRVTSIKI